MTALLRKVSMRDLNKEIFEAGLSQGSEKPKLYLALAALDLSRNAQAEGEIPSGYPFPRVAN